MTGDGGQAANLNTEKLREERGPDPASLQIERAGLDPRGKQSGSRSGSWKCTVGL